MDDKTNTGSQQHGPGCFFCETVEPLFEKVWTDATRNHFRNSRIEFLKGIRSLIDTRIEHLSRANEPKGTHVPVD